MAFFLRKNIKFVFTIILLIIVIFISFRGADNPVRGTVFFLTSPILKIFHGFSEGFHGLFEFLGSIGNLKDDNENLIKKNLDLNAQIARLSDVGKENEELRKEIGLLPRNKYTLEAAEITAEDSLGASGVVLINAGENRGIHVGMPVIILNGILIGKVSQVFANTSQVMLMTDRDSAINGEVLESGAKGIVKGTYGLGIMMDMISQTEVIKEGDTVITSGLGGGMPRGLFIGKIGQVSQTEDKLFQQASVISSVGFSSLREAFVVKNF
jgi:rod shape-determining protein MreC